MLATSGRVSSGSNDPTLAVTWAGLTPVLVDVVARRGVQRQPLAP
jgi:hypothetical protein